MDNIFEFLSNIPGLDVFLILAGALMIGLDLRKLYRYAVDEVEKKDFSFQFILPGLAFFTIGFMLMN